MNYRSHDIWKSGFDSLFVRFAYPIMWILLDCHIISSIFLAILQMIQILQPRPSIEQDDIFIRSNPTLQGKFLRSGQRGSAFEAGKDTSRTQNTDFLSMLHRPISFRNASATWGSKYFPDWSRIY